MILFFPVYIRAILKAASLASVPLVAKKNFSSPAGNTSSSFALNLARADVAYTGPINASSLACSAMDSTTRGFLCPRLTHISCALKSRYRLPAPSVIQQPSASAM